MTETRDEKQVEVDSDWILYIVVNMITALWFIYIPTRRRPGQGFQSCMYAQQHNRNSRGLGQAQPQVRLDVR